MGKEAIDTLVNSLFIPIIGFFFRFREMEGFVLRLNGQKIEMGKVISVLIRFALTLGIILILLQWLLKPVVERIIKNEENQKEKKMKKLDQISEGQNRLFQALSDHDRITRL